MKTLSLVVANELEVGPVRECSLKQPLQIKSVGVQKFENRLLGPTI